MEAGGGWAVISAFQAAVLLRLSQDSHDTHRNREITDRKGKDKAEKKRRKAEAHTHFFSITLWSSGAAH